MITNDNLTVLLITNDNLTVVVQARGSVKGERERGFKSADMTKTDGSSDL